MRNLSIIGVALILAGVSFLLHNMGFFSFSFLAVYWPIFLILAGISLIFGRKGMFTLFLLAAIISGLAYAGDIPRGEYRSVNEVFSNENNLTRGSIGIDYGAGELLIERGEDSSLAMFDIKTNDINDPVFDIVRTSKDFSIRASRQSRGFNGFWHIYDDWKLGLNPNIIYELDLDYGAADTKIDLRGLKVSNLAIESGATSTEITFSDYLTKADIDTGASSYTLYFPEGSAVRINTDVGASSVQLPGFTKDGNSYYNIKDASDYIEVDINAGASSIEGKFYGDEK